MAFAEKLKFLRQKNNMSQETVAQHMNVARSTIAGYETKNRQPSHEKLLAFSEFFHVPVDFLLDGTHSDSISLDISRIDSDDAQNLLLRYHHLSARSKEDLLNHLHLLELQDEEQTIGSATSLHKE